MDAKIQRLLDETIEKEIQTISAMKEGEEKSDAITNLTQLHKMRVEEIKAEQGKYVQETQAKTQNLDRWINIGVQVGLAVSSLIAYNAWYNRGLRFEETGSITSPMTRNLLSRMLPKK